MPVSPQALVPRDIVSPTPYAASKSTWDPFFLAYFSYRQEIGPDRKQNSAAPGESSQCLPLAPEVYIIDPWIRQSVIPANSKRILGTDIGRPRKRAISLDKVIIAFNRSIGSHFLEKSTERSVQLLFELRNYPLTAAYMYGREPSPLVWICSSGIPNLSSNRQNPGSTIAPARR
jgi:hypothetical protein